MREIENDILIIKGNLGATLGYDWINLPVLYTQVVTLAVYSYFGFALLGRQWLDTTRNIPGYDVHVDYYIPIFTCLQYLFYVGWLKVAEALLNPYGEDDDDFDMNWMIGEFLCYPGRSERSERSPILLGACPVQLGENCQNGRKRSEPLKYESLYLGRAKRASIHVTIVALREIHAVSDAIWFLCTYGR